MKGFTEKTLPNGDVELTHADGHKMLRVHPDNAVEFVPVVRFDVYESHDLPGGRKCTKAYMALPEMTDAEIKYFTDKGYEVLNRSTGEKFTA